MTSLHTPEGKAIHTELPQKVVDAANEWYFNNEM